MSEHILERRGGRGASAPGRTNAELDKRVRELEQVVAGYRAQEAAEVESRKPSLSALAGIGAILDTDSGRIVFKVSPHDKSVRHIGTFDSQGRYEPMEYPSLITAAPELEGDAPAEIVISRGGRGEASLSDALAAHAAYVAEWKQKHPTVYDSEEEARADRVKLYATGEEIDTLIAILRSAITRFNATAATIAKRSGNGKVTGIHDLTQAYNLVKYALDDVIAKGFRADASDSAVPSIAAAIKANCDVSGPELDRYNECMRKAAADAAGN